MFMYIMPMSIAIIIINQFYKRTYMRRKITEHRVILVNKINISLRIFSMSTILLLLSLNGYNIYLKCAIHNRLISPIDTLLFLGFVALVVFRGYLEIQNDAITDDALFIREGNYYFKDLESYSWNVSHDLKFGERDIKYDKLLLIIKPKNLFERTFKGKNNFEVEVRVRKNDVELVDSILEDYILE